MLNKITDTPKIFLDTSDNKIFNIYLNTTYKEQKKLLDKKKSINNNLKLNLININDKIISPDDGSKVSVNNLKYNIIKDNIKKY